MGHRAFTTRLVGLFLIGAGLIVPLWLLAQEASKASPAAAAEVTAEPAPAMIQRGRDLFLGTERFSAGGPACNSCHNVVNDAVPGGGTLAVNLTEAFDQLGADGIIGVLPRKGTESPFPLMQEAFQGHELTDEESNALVAFLQDANAKSAEQKPNHMSNNMLVGGVAGVVALLLFFSLTGRGRKRRSVNQRIYDRQLRSE